MRISLLRFFKTFQIYLANAIIVFFILLLLSFSILYVYFANAVIWLMRFYVLFISLLRLLAKNLPNAIFG